MIDGRNQRRLRRGYSLLELIVGMMSATLLMAGLASSLFISSRALDGSPAAYVRSRAAEVQAEMLSDLSEATSFSNRGADSVTFTVPDRDGDDDEETIAYSWDSGTNELSCSYNGSPDSTLLEDVTSFQLSYASRSMAAGVELTPFDPNDWGERWSQPSNLVFVEFTEAKEPDDQTELAILTPAGTTEGDLLIAAVATRQQTTNDIQAPAGWTLIDVGDCGADTTFGVWWRIAKASEPASHLIDWNRGAQTPSQAYGWIMRFTGHAAASPIHASAFTTGSNTKSPTSPSVTTTVDGALILRLGAFTSNKITVDSPGLSGHTPITMDYSKDQAGGVSAGGGYVAQEAAGSSGTSTFSLTRKKAYRTVTVAIAPD